MDKKDVSNFVYYITHCKTLTRQQIARRDKLMSRDFTSLLNSDEDKTELASPIIGNKKKVSNEKSIHNPMGLASFMSMFTSKGNVLKYTTHPWDESDNHYESFDAFYEKYSKEMTKHPFWSDFYKSAPHYYYLIDNFLRKDTFEDKFWGKNKFRIGYNSDKVLKDWMDANPNKQPYDMPLSAFGDNKIPEINGFNLVNFEDLVNVFKELIEFRSNKLFHTVRQAFTGQGLIVDKKKLETLRGKSFYTDTEYVSDVISRISKNIKNRSEYPNVEIWSSLNKNEDGYEEIFLHILHIDSYSYADINSDKVMLKGKGEIGDIVQKLSGLCDFSITSIFESEGKKKTFTIEYLPANESGSPKIKEYNSNCRGFEYTLKFYKA